MLHFEETQEKKEFELIEKGDYEVTLEAEWKERNGNRFINCTFKIRKDVEQKYQGRLVFDAIYKKKDSEDYSPSKINGILSAIPFAKRDFEDYDELVQYINNRNMIVTIDVQEADGAYAARNIIKYLSYRPTDKKPTLEPAGDDIEIPF